jgi:hypothetical protein
MMYLGKYLGLSSNLVMIPVVLWFLAVPVVSIRFQLWRCPRCGEGFAYKWWYNKSAFARKCVHCGLTKNELANIARDVR